MNARIALFLAVAALGLLLGVVCAEAHDYWIYEEWTPPYGPYITGVNGFVDNNNLLGRGTGKEYLFFVHGPAYCGQHTAYVYEVITTCPPGSTVRTHPENSENRGPVCDRTFVYVKSKGWGAYCSGHDNDFYVDDSGVYYGGSNNGVAVSTQGTGTGLGFGDSDNCTIMHYDFDLNPLGCVVKSAAPGVQDISFNKYRQEWWAGGADRRMWRYDNATGDWKFMFSYPDMGGSHHDGQEIVGLNYIVSDMTFDALRIYKLDTCGKPTGDSGYFTYNDPYTQNVEVMGYGPNSHLWISGWNNGRIYELGGGKIQGAFEDPDLFEEICKEVKGDWMPGFGNYSCCGDDTEPGEDFMNIVNGSMCVQTTDGWKWVAPRTAGQVFRLYYFGEVRPDCNAAAGNDTPIYTRGEAVFTDDGPLVCGDIVSGYMGRPRLLNTSIFTLSTGDAYASKEEVHGYLCSRRGNGTAASFPILECPGTAAHLNQEPIPILVGPDVPNRQLLGDYRRLYKLGENATSGPDGRQYWCSANGTWLKSLDGDKRGCDAASDQHRTKTGFRPVLWTGSRCCGEEGAEFYNDRTPNATLNAKGVLAVAWYGNGCWGGRPVRGFGAVERNVNDIWPLDPLTVPGNGTMPKGSIMNMNGTFHVCHASLPAALPTRPIGIVRTCRAAMNETCPCLCMQEADGRCTTLKFFDQLPNMTNHVVAYDKRDATCAAPCTCEAELVDPRVLW